MKPERLLILIIAGAIGAFVGYLLMSFLCWNFDPGTWGAFTHPVWNGKDYEIKYDDTPTGLLRFLGVIAMAGGSAGSIYGAWKLTEEKK